MAVKKFFVQVECSVFRRVVNGAMNARIKHTGYETVIFDDDGDVLGILHAASIDDRGRCHPPAYFLNRAANPVQQTQKLRLVA